MGDDNGDKIWENGKGSNIFKRRHVCGATFELSNSSNAQEFLATNIGSLAVNSVLLSKLIVHRGRKP
jgi:hypothetical protein